MMPHKENVLPQPASPAAFCCTFLLHCTRKSKESKKIKRKSKKISKIQHTDIRTKKGDKKGAKKGAEPKRESEGCEAYDKKEKMKNGGEHNGDFNEEI